MSSRKKNPDSVQNFGFVRVATATPRLQVANPDFNALEIISLMERAEKENVAVLLFPELSITGYTCGDLFHNLELLNGAQDALEDICEAWRSQPSRKAFSGIAFVGVPLLVDNVVFNCAVAISRGQILGAVQKSFLPNAGEFYEWRWFSPSECAVSTSVSIGKCEVPFGADLLFAAADMSSLVIGIDVCEDGWAADPPSTMHALFGATVIANISASPEWVSKTEYRRTLFTMRSATLMAAYLYTSAGVHESTSDLVFGGHQLICENGTLLGEQKPFERESTLTVADIDLERLQADRMRIKSYSDARRRMKERLKYRRINFFLGKRSLPVKLLRKVDAQPFVPCSSRELNDRCEDIFNIQVAGLAKRLEQLGKLETEAARLRKLKQEACRQRFPVPKSRTIRDTKELEFDISSSSIAHTKHTAGDAGTTASSTPNSGPSIVIGVSGGLDSTLALLVACRTMDLLGLPRTNVRGFTMPGFGTTDRTKGNAVALMKELQISIEPVADIKAACLEEMRQTSHKPFNTIDIEQIYAEAAKQLDTSKPFSLDDLQSIAVNLFTDALKKLPPGSEDLTFENVQARMRTKILMDSGFVLGTGDLSELALGWCTYNGDHMSMYGVNAGVPKTLVKFLVRWAAQNHFQGEARRLLMDIVATDISPELLPTGQNGKIAQKTENVIGPYELADFFLYYMLRFGFRPEKIIYLAKHADFDGHYQEADLRKWLKVFINRFFKNQFKRNCLPDGPKVGSVCLSPRSDWRMPSDADAALWLAWSEEQADSLVKTSLQAKK